MKLIAFILSIYILALNFTPCEDSLAIDNSSQSEFSQILDLDHEHNALDLCSPFCQCQCCQISVDFVAFYSSTLMTDYIFSINSSYKNSETQDVLYSLLQPPQV